MAEPVTLVAGGLLLYGWLRSRGAPAAPVQGPAATNPAGLASAPAQATAGNQPISLPGAEGTGPDAPLATNTSVAAGEAGVGLSDAPLAVPVPADLVSALDADTAMAMRAYVALNPEDFQVFLNRYASYIQLRDDLYVEALTNPPEAGFEPTPGMVASMGSAAYKVVQALNGVAVGRYGDLFGAAASAAGSIPGVDPMLVKTLQGLTLGYRAFSAGLTLSQISSIAAANGVGIMDVTASMLAAGTQGAVGAQIFGAEAVGALPGSLAAAPIASMAGVLMAAGLIIDIGFTIVGDAPDVQKAVDIALDVASLVCLFIPVVGWVIALVIQVVKFIIDLFGEDLFGGGLTREQKEMLELAAYIEKVDPMFPEIAAAYTPRELFATLIAWGSGYCGGRHVVAMGVNLILKPGDQLMIGGALTTVPGDPADPNAGWLLGFGDNEQPGGCYWLKSGPFAAITNDEQAWALARYGPDNGVIAGAQVGISEARQTMIEEPVVNLVRARTAPMQNFLKHGLSLDDIDQVALEYRAQPHLRALAQAFGWEDWQHLLASCLAEEWSRFTITETHGTLRDFARQNGYPSMFAFRAAAFSPFEALWSSATTLLAGLRSRKAMWDAYAQQQLEQLLWQQASSSAP